MKKRKYAEASEEASDSSSSSQSSESIQLSESVSSFSQASSMSKVSRFRPKNNLSSSSVLVGFKSNQLKKERSDSLSSSSV